jgi:hypothetical protein
MSTTKLYFSPTGGLQHQTEASEVPSPIEKSLAELDILLVLDEHLGTAGGGDEERSSSTPKSEEGNSDKENNETSSVSLKGQPKGGLDRFMDTQNSTGAMGSPVRNKSDTDDAKSVSSNTITSRDVTINSGDLISNMDQMQCTPGTPSKKRDGSKSVRSTHSRKSRRSRSSSSTRRRGPRGRSLERDVSRLIIQLTSDSSKFLVGEAEEQPKSVDFILTDLLASQSSQRGPILTKESYDNIHKISLLDDIEAVSLSPGLSNAALAASDACIEQTEQYSSNGKGDTLKRTIAIEGFETESDVFENLLPLNRLDDCSLKEYGQDWAPNHSEGIGDFTRNTILEEPVLFEDSVAEANQSNSTLVKTTTPLELTSSPFDIDTSYRSEASRLLFENTFKTTSANVVGNDEWTNFDSEGVFGEMFKPVEDQGGVSADLVSPSHGIGLPESPTSVFKVTIVPSDAPSMTKNDEVMNTTVYADDDGEWTDFGERIEI